MCIWDVSGGKNVASVVMEVLVSSLCSRSPPVSRGEHMLNQKHPQLLRAGGGGWDSGTDTLRRGGTEVYTAVCLFVCLFVY